MRGFILFLSIAIVVGSIAFFQIPEEKAFTFTTTQTRQNPEKVLYRFDIPMPQGVPSAHSSTLAILDDHRILSAFFAGTKEGAKDVVIYGSILDNKNQLNQANWQTPFKILDRQTLMQDSKEYISKLGNPVLYTLDDTIHLFVVGVSIGGWATSKIYHYSANPKDENLKFQFKKALALSPLLNISNLVRTQPISITLENEEKQGFILPIYHEIANKYAINLVFDSAGNILRISKPNNAIGLLQPALVALDSTHCLLAYRAHKKAKGILYTQACDNHLNYSDLIITNLSNEDNSLNLFSINESTFLLHNIPQENSPRAKLVVEKMQDYNTFSKLFDLDTTYTMGGEVSYPTTIVDHNTGMIHITYTVDRKFIRHVAFSTKFLEVQQ